MRAIDADAFDKCLEDAENEAIHMHKYVFASALNTIRGNLRTFPTIEPERTGRWIPHPVKEFLGWDVCTACGVGCKRREYEDGGMTEYGYIFCPNCGSRMMVDANAKMEVEHETD